MASRMTDPAPWRALDTLYRIGTVGDLTDGQLLERFVNGTGGAAEAGFAALVERHGPMVLRVCRQVLGDSDDAQDAFQATFLVLVRRARSVRRRDSVASWLFGVARRVARRAKVDAARRRTHEAKRAAEQPETAPPAGEPESWTELHEEVERLPEKYRSAVVLCYLEGLTTEAAARRLGCPQGTVLSRLSRAREQLRGRLIRRGAGVPAGMLTAGSTPIAGTVAVPPGLIQATTQAALELATGRAIAGIVPASVAVLTSQITRDLLMTKLIRSASILLAIGAISVGAVGLARQAPGGKGADDGSRPSARAGGASRGDSERIQGTWIMIAQETNGDEVPPEKDVKMVVTADTLATVYPEGDPWQEQDRKNGKDRVSYRIEPSRQPKTIDLTDLAGPRKGKTTLGIYRVDGDTLQICIDTDDGERPTGFDTESGDHARLMIFRRDIPVRVPAAPVPGTAAGREQPRQPVLEFRIMANRKHDRGAVAKALKADGMKTPPDGYRLVTVHESFKDNEPQDDIVRIIRKDTGPDGKPRRQLLVKLDPQNVTEKDVASFEKTKNDRDQAAILLRFTPDGARRFGRLTRNHLPEEGDAFKYRLAIIIDGDAVSAPVINSEIRDAAIIEFGGKTAPEQVDEIIRHLEAARTGQSTGNGSP